MSEPKDDEPRMDEVARALADTDALLPESLAEVARAEAEIDEAEVDLPEGLRKFAPREQRTEGARAPAEVVPLSRRALPIREKAKSTRAVTFLSGAATGLLLAASALFAFWSLEEPVTPQVGGTPDELRPEDPELRAPIPLDLSAKCDDCCAGSACSSAKTELASCPSGRTCISCAPGNQRSAYRIRLSALGLTPEGRAWLEKEGRSLEGATLCAAAGTRPLGCRAALEESSDLLGWSSLPTATTSAQLVGGMVVSLVDARGATLGGWANSVHASPDTLCRGAALRITADGTDVVLGKVSAFFDDTYFVELGRRATVSELSDLSLGFAWRGGAPAIFETTKKTSEHFALALGPFSLSRAEEVRWLVLDTGRDAAITTGADHVGSPRPLESPRK